MHDQGPCLGGLKVPSVDRWPAGCGRPGVGPSSLPGSRSRRPSCPGHGRRSQSPSSVPAAREKGIYGRAHGWKAVAARGFMLTVELGGRPRRRWWCLQRVLPRPSWTWRWLLWPCRCSACGVDGPRLSGSRYGTTKAMFVPVRNGLRVPVGQFRNRDAWKLREVIGSTCADAGRCWRNAARGCSRGPEPRHS
jgi:hypothetical protein